MIENIADQILETRIPAVITSCFLVIFERIASHHLQNWKECNLTV